MQDMQRGIARYQVAGRPVRLRRATARFAADCQKGCACGIGHAHGPICRWRIVRDRLGRTVGKQPRQFNVEPTTLLAHAEFQTRLDYVLRRSLPASLGHVIAVDEASEGFADQIARFAPAPAQMVRRTEVGSIPTQTQSAIVIAGLVIESGRSLLDISRDLRSIAPNAPLLYLAGFSKSTGEPRRETLDRHAYPDRQSLPLPDDRSGADDLAAVERA